MITREQVKDLRPGDVVEVAPVDDVDCGDGAYTFRGPVRASQTGGPELYFFDFWLRDKDGAPGPWIDRLTVISRAPCLYVNHDRGAPETGDVATAADARHVGEVYVRWSNGWAVPGSADVMDPEDAPSPLRLLIDGETGQVVP